MKIVFSPLVAGMSGRAADVVAAAWKGVSYVRKFVVPHNPKSASQITQRGHMARMSPLFRSLPTAITTWLDDLAVGLGKSGFNLMVREDLRHFAAAENLEIVPANPKENALFSIADDTGGASEVKVIWVAGSAITSHWVHLFTCPVDPDEGGKEEPDGWTYHDADVTLVSGTVSELLTVANAAKDYYVVCLVADHATLASASNISGGVAETIASGA